MTQSGYKLDRQGGTTAREREVLDLLASGASHVEISEAIGVSRQRVGQIVRALEKKELVRPPAINS